MGGTRGCIARDTDFPGEFLVIQTVGYGAKHSFSSLKAMEFEREERSLLPSAIQTCAARFSERSFQREMSKLLLGKGLGESESRFDVPANDYLQVAGFTKA